MPEPVESLGIVAPTPESIARAAELLRAGHLVAFPTETVYGLGADATQGRAVAAIFAAKDRPRFNPLIVHVRDLESARALGVFAARAEALAQAFWPGPLTLVVPRSPACAADPLVSAGLETIALRVPGHDLAQSLLAACAAPLAAPSANRSGHLSPTRASHVGEDLGARVALILDGGPCRVGIESTVVGLADETPVLLRPGAVAAETIKDVIGPLVHADDRTGAAPSPGMQEHHYAPARPLRMNAADVRPGEALLAFGGAVPGGAVRTLNLSAEGDLVAAAANLFSHLHDLDRDPATGIAVMPVPDEGLGAAINDRLRRAAA